MALIQLDFFEQTDISVIKCELTSMKDSQNRCRKKQFADIGTIRKDTTEQILLLKKEIEELKELVNLLVRNICHANN
jgi:hypothetical protein